MEFVVGHSTPLRGIERPTTASGHLGDCSIRAFLAWTCQRPQSPYIADDSASKAVAAFVRFLFPRRVPHPVATYQALGRRPSRSNATASRPSRARTRRLGRATDCAATSTGSSRTTSRSSGFADSGRTEVRLPEALVGRNGVAHLRARKRVLVHFRIFLSFPQATTPRQTCRGHWIGA